MRVLRWFLASALLASVLVLPTVATANGGAYIEFRRSTGGGGGSTHFAVGGSAVGKAVVYVPPSKEFLFQRGPFYAFLLPTDVELREGRPTPSGAIRLGTFQIAERKGMRFDLSVSFAVPSVHGGYYAVALCNDPCTVSGFRESLVGTISIVETAREARLLTGQARLRAKLVKAHRDLRSVVREQGQVQTLLDLARQDVSESQGHEAALRRSLVAARAEARQSNPLTAWVVGLAALATSALAALLILRRRWKAAFVVPDTIRQIEPSIRTEA